MQSNEQIQEETIQAEESAVAASAAKGSTVVGDEMHTAGGGGRTGKEF